MTTPSYPVNTHKAREKVEPTKKAEEKKVERVINSPVARRKKSMGKRLKEIFITGDDQSVGSYVLFDVIVPATRELIVDVVTQGVERTLFGEVRSSGRRSGSSMRNGRVSYNSYSKSPMAREEPRTISRRARASHDFEEVILGSMAEGNEVIDNLFMLAEKYNVATVADLYELVGIQTSHVDQKYGWTDLRPARVVQVRGGWLLDLPQPELLD